MFLFKPAYAAISCHKLIAGNKKIWMAEQPRQNVSPKENEHVLQWNNISLQ